MATVKQGHTQIVSSLRPDEVTVLDEQVTKMEAFRLWALRSPERYREHRPSPNRVTRAGFIRAAVRYALARLPEFEEWLYEERTERGTDDAQ